MIVLVTMNFFTLSLCTLSTTAVGALDPTPPVTCEEGQPESNLIQQLENLGDNLESLSIVINVTEGCVNLNSLISLNGSNSTLSLIGNNTPQLTNVTCNNTIIPNTSTAFLPFVFSSFKYLSIEGIKFINCAGGESHDVRVSKIAAVFLFYHCYSIRIINVDMVNYGGGFAFMFVNPKEEVMVKNAVLTATGQNYSVHANINIDYGAGIYLFFDHTSVKAELDNINISGGYWECVKSEVQEAEDEAHVETDSNFLPYCQAQGLTIIFTKHSQNVSASLSRSDIYNNVGCRCAGIFVHFHPKSSVNSRFEIKKSRLRNNHVLSDLSTVAASLLVLLTPISIINPFGSLINSQFSLNNNIMDNSVNSNASHVILFINDTDIHDHKDRTPVHILSIANEFETIYFKDVRFFNNVVKDQAICMSAVNLYRSSNAYPKTTITMEGVKAFNNHPSRVVLRYENKMDMPLVSSSALFVFVDLRSITIKNHDANCSDSMVSNCNASYYLNTATIFMGVSTDFTVMGTIGFASNSADFGTCFQLRSFTHIFLHPGVSVAFFNNTAYMVGGAITSFSEGNDYSMCFIQFSDTNYSNYDLIFKNNTAKFVGDDIYGDRIYDCFIYGMRNLSSDDIYLKIFKNTTTTRNIIATPFKVHVYAKNDTIIAYPGQCVHIKLKVTDKNRNMVPSLVYSSVSIKSSHIFQLNKTTFYYNKNDNADPSSNSDGYQSFYSTVIYNTTKKNTTENAKNIDVYFSTKYGPDYKEVTLEIWPCPAGFHLTNGTCNCSLLEGITSECDITGGIRSKQSTWFNCIKAINNSSSFVCKYSTSCTGGYCEDSNHAILEKADSIGSNNCKGNRTGTVCGSCEEHNSALFGTVNCRICKDNKPLAVILTIWLLSGIASVSIIYFLRLTLNQGTIGSFLFYAHVTYLSLNRNTAAAKGIGGIAIMDICQWFVSIPNFNLSLPGFCFFKGMTDLQKHALFFCSPTYLCLIVIFIIIVSRWSLKISNLTSHLSVQVLVTLFHLLYAQFLVLIIRSFTYIIVTEIHYNGTTTDKHERHVVWYYSGEVHYGKNDHLLLLIFSGLVGAFILLPYLLLSLFAPFLYFHSWIIKFLAVFDTMFAPYKENCRHWFGYRLLVLTAINIGFACTIGSQKEWEMHIQVSILLIYLLALAMRQPLKHNVQNYLEIWFTANAAGCAILEVHATSTVVYGCKLGLMFMAFVTTCLILIYHIGLRVKIMVKEKVQKQRSTRHEEVVSLPEPSVETSVRRNYGSLTNTNSQLRESLLSDA